MTTPYLHDKDIDSLTLTFTLERRKIEITYNKDEDNFYIEQQDGKTTRGVTLEREWLVLAMEIIGQN